MEKEKSEKRFDVRVPLENTLLLGHLATESKRTGTSEARLLVQYATNFVEKWQGLVLTTTLGVAQSSPGHVRSGNVEVWEPEAPTGLDEEALDSMYGDPD